MLSVKLENVAIVVLSESNNPRLLNPDFLERNNIVPKEWKAQDVLVTPPFAQVSYSNGVQILVEENKIHLQSNKPEAIAWKRELPKITLEYLEVLPHVSYRAVGLNFVYLSDHPKGIEAEKELISKLLQQGPWLNFGQGISGAVIELQYRGTQPQMNVKIGVIEKDSPTGKLLGGFIFTVNFHHDFKPDQNEERAAYINSIGARQAEFIQFLEKLPF